MARVLIADDSGTMRSVLRKIITAAHHEVVGEAKDGLEAIDLFKELSPDVTTLDIMMPKMDGLSALKVIMEADPSAAVVMVTSDHKMKDAVEAAELGAVGYVVKPFDKKKVEAAISAAAEPQ